ncbi:DUF4129 domain-containing protein [Bacillus infantis]|uniref:DUF4129 domain-containing protein n=1 Tax=Bacillus infantis TaxID=324767 RepID=UPI0020A1220D|nr:DUF4129 domain-containing protein [Bacillus infantis]MCP1158666.1 DUF4129 domain-containing protein [Bacillus infantis]
MKDAEQARKELSEILEDREYTVYQNQGESFLEKLREKFFTWLEELFPQIEFSSGSSGAFPFIMILAGVLFIGIVMFAAARAAKRQKILQEQQPLDRAAEISWSYKKHLEEAGKHEESGDLTKGARHIFLALLLWFNEYGWLNAKIWKTNWDYYEELKRTDTKTAEVFYSLSALFDRAAYGGQSIKASEFQQFKREALRLMDNSANLQEGRDPEVAESAD